jgi:hypothetical protein
MGWLTGWTYRKSVPLSRASGLVTNYQMKLLVGESSGATGEDVDCNSHCAADFDDIRFTASDGTTLLDYWIESITGTTPNQLATIWIEFDSIGTTDTTFYMYYGNAGASAVSSGDDTFLFFDHFLGSSLGAQWSFQGTPSVDNSEVTLVSNDTTWEAIKAALYTVTYARFRSRFKQSVMTNHAAGFSNSAMSGTFYADDSVYFLGVYDASIYYISSNEGTITQTGHTNLLTAGVYYIGELLWKSGECKYYLDNSLKATYTTNIANEACAPRFDACHASGNGNLVADWVFVGQYLSPEPAWGSWGQESSQSKTALCTVVCTVIPPDLPH